MTRRPLQTTTCAAEGCDGPVTPNERGRPRIFCSPACRPGGARTAAGHLAVEVDHEPTPEHARPTGRIWSVRLRRASHTVVVASELGRPSADHLAAQIDGLINPRRRAAGAAME